MAIKLSGLAPQNPWWKYENWGRDDYDLKHLDIIFDRKDIEIKDGKLYIIRGIRRSGKTVYTKLLVKNLLE
ncbi:MAG TPA: ATP-binding protein, partial [Thermoplasmatales archaeon]|nr:ATP-binding protein [Thermoplasmatales archaeon]